MHAKGEHLMTLEKRLPTDPSQPRTAPLDWPVRGGREASDWGIDPGSGARVMRLTSSPLHHSLIYTEQPYTSPDGRRVAIRRNSDHFSPSVNLLIADVEDGGLWLVEPSISGEIAHSAYGEWLHYLTFERGLRRVSLLTLEKQQVLPDGAVPEGCQIVSMTPDLRTLYIYDTRDPEAPALSTMDIATGTITMLYQDANNRNPHAQSDQAGGMYVLMQQSALKPGHPVEVFIIDRATGRRTLLPIGGESTAQSSGHMAWIGQSMRVACAVNWRRDERLHDARHPGGNLVIAGLDDPEPRIVGGPGHAFYHVSVSRCGRYFTCDDFMDMRIDGLNTLRTGPVRVVVGSIETGRCRTLISDVQVNGIAGSADFEPNPYMTADNRHVVYNGSPWGIQQSFVATVPEGFLDGLG